MSIGFLFWLLMVIWLIFGIVVRWGSQPSPRLAIGGDILLYILLFLLGWGIFGFVIHN